MVAGRANPPSAHQVCFTLSTSGRGFRPASAEDQHDIMGIKYPLTGFFGPVNGIIQKAGRFVRF
jgi:hypothetical protein